MAVDGVISGCRKPAHEQGGTPNRWPVRRTSLCERRGRQQQRYEECKARVHSGSIALFSPQTAIGPLSAEPQGYLRCNMPAVGRDKAGVQRVPPNPAA